MPDPTDTPPLPPARSPFPWWVVLGGLLLAAAYLPTLAAPFDFVDDGNLVYPTRGLDVAGHARLWWERVAANVQHLGPFRPAVWAHWQLAANVFGADAVAWRCGRLVWCALAATMLLWFLREMRVNPAAALVAGAAAMWNPYRNDIWVSLTLAEGVAMPYALLALVAARKAANAGRGASRWWDAAAVGGLLVALGCKNVFAAVIPAMLALRVWTDGGTLAAGWRLHRWRAGFYLLPVLLPVAHFVWFKLHWRAGYYETPGPSWEQAKQFALWLKGAAGVDFLAAGAALVAAVVWWQRQQVKQSPPPAPSQTRGGAEQSRPLTLVVAGLLLACGFTVYLPMNIMCGRYTMPAVWGTDVLFALLLTRFVALPQSWPKRIAWAGVAVGLIALVVACVGRQEKTAARSRLLWAALEHVETTAPRGSAVEWIGISGEGEAGELNAEEGIHFAWHLHNRGRTDVRIGLTDLTGRPIPRVELPPLDGPTDYRIASKTTDDPPTWRTERTFDVPYRYGWKHFACELDVRLKPPAASTLDPATEHALQRLFDPARGSPLNRLTPTEPDREGLSKR